MAELTIKLETVQLLRLSDEEYFSDAYKDYLSNSKIGLINPDEGGSLTKFTSGFKDEYSDSYALGSAVHCALLQEEDFIISDIKKPSGKLGLFAEEVYNFRAKGNTISNSLELASKKANYYANSFSPTRVKNAIKTSIPFYKKRYPLGDVKNTIFMSENLHEKYLGCKNSVLNNHEIMNLLKPEAFFEAPEVFNEYAILCELEFMTNDGEFIPLKFKGKIDNFTINHEEKKITLNDLKTTGKPISYFMGNTVEREEETIVYEGSFEKYRYYRQLAVYMWLLQAAIQTHMPDIKNYTYECNIIVVEGFPEYKSDYFKISSKMIKKGLVEFKTLLNYIAEWKKYQ